MFQGVGVGDQVWDTPLPSSAIVAVVVAQPVDLLRESVFAGLGVAPRAAFVGAVSYTHLTLPTILLV